VKEMNIIATIATAVAAIVLVAFFVKKDCKPALSVFVIATASILLFLYGKLATTEMPWLIGAVLLWIVIAIIVLKTARENGKVVIPLIIIVAMIITGIAFLAPKVSTETQDNSAKEMVTQPVDANDPNGEWALWNVDRGNNRIIASGIDAETAKKAQDNRLQLAKHDATALTVYAYQESLIPSDKTDPSLYITEDGKYLNQAGRDLWNKLDGKLAGATSTFANAPTGDINSGTTGSGFYVGQSGSVGGTDTKTLVSTYPNGTSTETLVRCGNPVFSGPTPGVPTGTTDNPLSGGNGGPPVTPPTIEQKDPSESTLVNPEVAPWKQDDVINDGEAERTVSNENGATVSNGDQANPVQDAANATADAAATAAENAEAQKEAVNDAVNNGGGVVDNNQNHTVATDPVATDPNW